MTLTLGTSISSLANLSEESNLRTQKSSCKELEALFKVEVDLPMQTLYLKTLTSFTHTWCHSNNQVLMIPKPLFQLNKQAMLHTVAKNLPSRVASKPKAAK